MKNNDDYVVSVLCMTYNQSAYIVDAMNGFAMQQTNFPFVAVVVDDASTDGEQEVINTYVDEHFDHSVENGFKQWETADACWTFARHKANENCHLVVVCLKRNLFKEPEKKKAVIKDWMNAKFTAICEGDDYWTDPLKLQKQVDFLEEHEEYSMCCTAFSQTFDGHEESKQIVRYDLDEITVDELLKERWIGTLTTLYRSKLMSDYAPPFPNLPFGDLPMWFHLALKGRVKYMKDVTANYRSLSNSACHSPDKKKQFAFSLHAMRVREYYALKMNRIEIAQPFFSKKSHYYFEMCYRNQWFDFSLDTLWHFVKEYGRPSGYDKLKYFGMKSRINYSISKSIISFLKK